MSIFKIQESPFTPAPLSHYEMDIEQMKNAYFFMTKSQLTKKQETIKAEINEAVELDFPDEYLTQLVQEKKEITLCLSLFELAENLPGFVASGATRTQDIYGFLNTMDFNKLNPEGKKVRNEALGVAQHLGRVAGNAALDTAGVMLDVGLAAGKFAAKKVGNFCKKSRVAVKAANAALKEDKGQTK